jgi:hypothetical protein
MGAKNSKGTIPTNADLPDDLIKYILEYCSLPLLIRFQCTSKPWKKYIGSQKVPQTFFFVAQPKTIDEFILAKHVAIAPSEKKTKFIVLLGNASFGQELFYQIDKTTQHISVILGGTTVWNTAHGSFFVQPVRTEEGIKKLHFVRQAPSLIVLIPEDAKSGVQYYKQVRDLIPDIPVVCMTQTHNDQYNVIPNKKYKEICAWASEEKLPIFTITNNRDSKKIASDFMQQIEKAYSLSLSVKPLDSSIQIVQQPVLKK